MRYYNNNQMTLHFLCELNSFYLISINGDPISLETAILFVISSIIFELMIQTYKTYIRNNLLKIKYNEETLICHQHYII